MKKLFITSILLSMVSCGAYVRTMTGGTSSKLIKTVALETGCKTENIKVLDKVTSVSTGTYTLDVCGKKMIYKQAGGIFTNATPKE